MRMHTQALRLLCLVLCTSLIFGCKKELNEITFKGEDVKKQSDRKPVTEREKQLVANLEKITLVLKEIYQNKNVIREVNAAVYANIYSDESILLKDLLFPEKGLLVNSNKYHSLLQKWNVTPGTFAKTFWAEANKKDNVTFLNFLNSLSPRSTSQMSVAAPDYASPDEVGIYFPYSQEFEEVMEPQEPGGGSGGSYITTLVTATADADEGIGYLPYVDSYGNTQYHEVLVNDDYAFENPTHIIGVNGIEPITTSPSGVSVFPPGNPIDVPNLPREVKQVYIGEVRCKTQYDRLISFTGNGGGSEIRITRGDGYLKLADGQVQADIFIVNGPDVMGRSDIRNQKWVDWTAAWDEDWEPANFEQFFAIYEDDNRNTGTLSFGLKTTLSVPVPGVPGATVGAERTIGGTLTYRSDDGIIKQTNYKHDVFFALNRFDLEGEMRNGWPVRDRNSSVSFTLLDKSLY